VSASAYYERRTGRRSARTIEDERLLERIREVHERNYCAYGYRRMSIALRREGEKVGKSRVQRLMRAGGIQGAKRRGKAWRTTKPDPLAHRRPDLVERDFSATAPNRLWVGDAYDNAMAESFVDTFKTELIADRSWRSRTQLELAVVEYVAWFNNDRLHESLGDVSPAEFEDLYVAQGV
jgi:putative transposase